MLDWIFGSSKSQKKQQNNTQDKLEEDQKWVYDFVKQYLVSPIWRNPLLDFIQQNCLIFQDTQENKFQYTKIFKQFTSLCSILVESIVQETGISFKTLQKCIIKGLKSKEDKKIYTQILICDNFQTFKRIMISKNKQLQCECLKKIRDQSKKQDKVQDKIDHMERQRLELQQAIAMSLALQQKAKEQQELQFKQAIRQSQICAQKQQPKKQQKKNKSLLGELPPLMVGPSKQYQSPAQIQQQKTRLNKQIQELKSTHKVDEDSQQRKKRLQQQRQLLRKRKQQQRNIQLKTFVQKKQANTISQGHVSEQELLKRKKLMNRLKEQLKND